MSRPLRIEIDGALYHVTARGDRRSTIFRTDSDRLTWLTLLGDTCARFDFTVQAYCQMGNHYHLVLATRQGQLARGMRHLNGNYSRYFNRQHALVGHVFQGRYKAILCQQETYLMQLARYVMLNPVRAGMVALPEHWAWSSYRATLGSESAPAWLDVGGVLAAFGERPTTAAWRFEQFVRDGIGVESPLKSVNCDLVLGDEAFRGRVLGRHVAGDLNEIKRLQRRATVPPLAAYFPMGCDVKEGMALAYRSLAYSMAEIARHCRVSVRTVSRAVKAHEEKIGRIEESQRCGAAVRMSELTPN